MNTREYMLDGRAQSIFSKILSKENLTMIVDGSADTASFDIVKRVLRIPNWKFDHPDTSYFMAAHECSHALHTPTSYIDKIKSKPKNEQSVYGGFLNIVEDCRIDRMILSKFPGLKPFYMNGITDLVRNRDFFGMNQKKIKELIVIDKINILAKTHLVGLYQIGFDNDIEQSFYDRAMQNYTFDEVITLTDEIYEYCKKNSLIEKLQGSSKIKIEFSDPGGDPGDDPTSDQYQNLSVEELEELLKEAGIDISGVLQELQSQTDQATKRSLQKSNVPQPTRANWATIPANSLIYKSRIRKFGASKCRLKSQKTDASSMKFSGDLDKVVMRMVTSFDRHKAAKDFFKTRQAKSGSIDVSKLAYYKTSDDLMRSHEILPEGDKYGVYVVIDGSGSMHHVWPGVCKQTYVLANFLKKIRIPFEISIFSSLCNEYYAREVPDMEEYVKTCTHHIVCTYSDKLSKINQTIAEMRHANLGGTPLTGSAMLSLYRVQDFIKEQNVDKVIVLYITDGEDTTSERVDYVVDDMNKRVYDVRSSGNHYLDNVKVILEAMKYRLSIHKIMNLYINSYLKSQKIEYPNIGFDTVVNIPSSYFSDINNLKKTGEDIVKLMV